jgi:exodeoxyribonuclease VII small subunit
LNPLIPGWTGGEGVNYSNAVPAGPKNGSAPGGAKDAPFEEALKNLEAIVEQMEGGELPLETMMARFEEGVRLVKTCQMRLEEAQIRISRLDQDAAGEPVLKPAETLMNDDE